MPYIHTSLCYCTKGLDWSCLEQKDGLALFFWFPSLGVKELTATERPREFFCKMLALQASYKHFHTAKWTIRLDIGLGTTNSWTLISAEPQSMAKSPPLCVSGPLHWETGNRFLLQKLQGYFDNQKVWSLQCKYYYMDCLFPAPRDVPHEFFLGSKSLHASSTKPMFSTINSCQESREISKCNIIFITDYTVLFSQWHFGVVLGLDARKILAFFLQVYQDSSKEMWCPSRKVRTTTITQTQKWTALEA